MSNERTRETPGRLSRADGAQSAVGERKKEGYEKVTHFLEKVSCVLQTSESRRCRRFVCVSVYVRQTHTR